MFNVYWSKKQTHIWNVVRDTEQPSQPGDMSWCSHLHGNCSDCIGAQSSHQILRSILFSSEIFYNRIHPPLYISQSSALCCLTSRTKCVVLFFTRRVFKITNSLSVKSIVNTRWDVLFGYCSGVVQVQRSDTSQLRITVRGGTHITVSAYRQTHTHL